MVVERRTGLLACGRRGLRSQKNVTGVVHACFLVCMILLAVAEILLVEVMFVVLGSKLLLGVVELAHRDCQVEMEFGLWEKGCISVLSPHGPYGEERYKKVEKLGSVFSEKQ